MSASPCSYKQSDESYRDSRDKQIRSRSAKNQENYGKNVTGCDANSLKGLAYAHRLYNQDLGRNACPDSVKDRLDVDVHTDPVRAVSSMTIDATTDIVSLNTDVCWI